MSLYEWASQGSLGPSLFLRHRPMANRSYKFSHRQNFLWTPCKRSCQEVWPWNIIEQKVSKISAADAGVLSESSPNCPKCAVCNEIEPDAKPLKQCGRCKNIKYYSTKCQEQDWFSHKSNCKAQNYIIKIDLEPGKITNPAITWIGW